MTDRTRSRDVVIAEYDRPDGLAAAAARVRALGYGDLEAYTPFPVPELDGALAIERTKIPRHVFAGGAMGAASGLFMQWWTNAYDYPLNVGGRPASSWPADIVIVFEMAVLFAALGAFAAVLLGSRLPRLHDALFDLPGFERTTIDRFWLAVRNLDPVHDDVARTELAQLRAALEESGAVAVRHVEASR